jgi:hypothetical protein
VESLTREIEDWIKMFGELKRYKALCASHKKIIDDSLSADKTSAEMLGWVKKKEDPELGLEVVMEIASSKGRYTEYGQWILDTPEFNGWAKTFRHVDSPGAARRAFWIHGSYGTGKSSLVFVLWSYARAS